MELNTETAAAAGRRYAEIDAAEPGPLDAISAFGEWEEVELTQEDADAAGALYSAILVAFTSAYKATVAALAGVV